MADVRNNYITVMKLSEAVNRKIRHIKENIHKLNDTIEFYGIQNLFADKKKRVP